MRAILVSVFLFLLAAPLQPQDAVIRTSVRAVEVNVVAQDRKGQPVTDLAKDDFIIKENGKERPIKLFSMETMGSRGAAGPGETAKSAGPMTFTNRVEESAGAVTIFLFDGLNTRFEDQAYAKRQLLKYLAEVDYKDRVALFSLGRTLTLLHDFTTDTKALIDEINRHKNRLNTEVADAEPEAADTGDPNMDDFLDNANQKIADFTNIMRASTTAAALEAIAEHTARIPGRKNLVWISSAFPMYIGFTPESFGNPSRENRDFSPETQRAIRALNDASIAVYPVDARGLRTNMTPASTGGGKRARNNTPPPSIAADRTYDTMEYLADGTGGKAFHDLNNLSAAIKTATSDARVSYVLTFTPPGDSLDGKYHQLKVEVKRSGVHIRYRKGYIAYADAPQPLLSQAIVSPLAYTGVGLRVTLETAASGLTAAVNVDPHNITLEQHDGAWTGQLEMMVSTSGAGPTAAAAPKTTIVKIKLPQDAYERVQKDGLTVKTSIQLPPGSVLNIGVRDVPSGSVGTLHLARKAG